MAKTALTIIIGMFFLVVAFEAVSFWGQKRAAEADYVKMKAQLDAESVASESLRGDIGYYADPANLEKELRARFNYRSPGEHMIVIVPGASGGASSTR
jgi:Zn-dependent protease with chaperone function